MFYVIELESGTVLFENLESGERAASLARHWQVTTGKKAGVRVHNNPQWENREIARFESGDYLPVAWANAQFWLEYKDRHSKHYAHRSKDKSRMIAFTESPEKGSQDRQTRIKAGAYLTKYFSDVLSESEINHYARLHASIENAAESIVQFATDPDKIEEIYTNGPDSCMSDNADGFNSRIHPVRVYGDSDLALAYVERESDYHENRFAARALVWPERKIYGRVYPTPERYSGSARQIAKAEYDGLISALESLGYQHGSFAGAKIRAIKDEESYVMPYLDGVQHLNLIGDYFEISKSGDYCATNTNGLLESYTCDQCGDNMSRYDQNAVCINRYGDLETWCESCVENHGFYCHGTGSTYSNNIDCVEIDGDTYSIHYAESHFLICDHSGDWTSESCNEVYIDKHGNTENWCESAISDHAFFCDGSGKYYSDSEFDSVEIDGSIYERNHAESDPILSVKLKELESNESETV